MAHTQDDEFVTVYEQLSILSKALRRAEAGMQAAPDGKEARKWADIIVGVTREINETLRVQQQRK